MRKIIRSRREKVKKERRETALALTGGYSKPLYLQSYLLPNPLPDNNYVVAPPFCQAHPSLLILTRSSLRASLNSGLPAK
jgi:hypothetical protein